jgi:hypothetical protein
LIAFRKPDLPPFGTALVLDCWLSDCSANLFDGKYVCVYCRLLM